MSSKSGISSKPLIDAWNLRVNKFDELDSLRVALANKLLLMEETRGPVWAWFYGIIAAHWDYFL